MRRIRRSRSTAGAASHIENDPQTASVLVTTVVVVRSGVLIVAALVVRVLLPLVVPTMRLTVLPAPVVRSA
jgi:hypothetical protein